MSGIAFDKRSLKNITNKLKAMPAKLQRSALRKAIEPDAKNIMNTFKSITPAGKRRHKNKYAKRAGTGFLKKSFSVRNSGRGSTVGRRIVTRNIGYYIFMSPNATGRKSGDGYGAVSGAKKYSRFWTARQNKVTSNIKKSLISEIGKL